MGFIDGMGIMLIILPSHLAVSGVATWAARTVGLLRSNGERAGLFVHTHGEDMPDFLEPFVVGCVTTGPAIDSLNGRVESLIPMYRQALDAVRPVDGSPVVVAPSVPGDCYGVVAALTQVDPDGIRVVSWIHSDNAYDIHVAVHYEPMIHAFVPVSRELEQLARKRMPNRADDVGQIDHAVDVPDLLVDRGSLAGRRVRMIYTGRIVEEQKRISALPAMVAELMRRGMAFDLKVVGDGPAFDELRRSFAGAECVEMLGRVPPADVAGLLEQADVWVNPSRYEGQCVAMLEAMAVGCVPIMARIDSGVLGIVEHGRRGLVADAGPKSSPAETGIRLAEAVEGFVRSGPGSMPLEAASYIGENHGPSRYFDRVQRMIAGVRAMPSRPWPTDRPVAFSSRGTGMSGSTPAIAGESLEAKLTMLVGRRVLIYGMGRHTLDLASVLACSKAEIVGVIDDHAPQECGRLWGWPVVKPECAGQLNATDVIISSYIHEPAIWENREILERQGLRVHRLYKPQ